MLETIIIVLLVAVVISLFAGLVLYFKDREAANSKRMLYLLGLRVSLAGMLLLVVFYGLYTGELQMSAPWHGAD